MWSGYLKGDWFSCCLPCDVSGFRTNDFILHVSLCCDRHTLVSVHTVCLASGGWKGSLGLDSHLESLLMETSHHRLIGIHFYAFLVSISGRGKMLPFLCWECKGVLSYFWGVALMESIFWSSEAMNEAHDSGSSWPPGMTPAGKLPGTHELGVSYSSAFWWREDTKNKNENSNVTRNNVGLFFFPSLKRQYFWS